MKLIELTKEALRDLSILEKNNPKYLAKVWKIIEEISQTPRIGSGKPERLKGHKIDEEFWSRRIDRKNRIVYQIMNDRILILSLIGHYSDN